MACRELGGASGSPPALCLACCWSVACVSQRLLHSILASPRPSPALSRFSPPPPPPPLPPSPPPSALPSPSPRLLNPYPRILVFAFNSPLPKTNNKNRILRAQDHRDFFFLCLVGVCVRLPVRLRRWVCVFRSKKTSGISIALFRVFMHLLFGSVALGNT